MKALAITTLMLALAVPAAAQTDQQQNPSQQADKCRMQTDQGGKQQPGGGNLTTSSTIAAGC
jgi:hypothetical protein